MSANVALCLAGAGRLQLAFKTAKTDKLAQRLLWCAADLIDKTVPAPEIALFAQTRQGTDQLSFLVEQRHLIAAVPPGLWPKRRVSAAQYPAPHDVPLRALEKSLKAAEPLTSTEKSALRLWLLPVLQAYPVLLEEIAGVWA